MRPGERRAIRFSAAGVVRGNDRVVDHRKNGVAAVHRAAGIDYGRVVCPGMGKLGIGAGVCAVGGSGDYVALKIPLITERGSAGGLYGKSCSTSNLGSLIHRLD